MVLREDKRRSRNWAGRMKLRFAGGAEEWRAAYPVWPARLLRSLQEVRFHTLTSLSLRAALFTRTQPSEGQSESKRKSDENHQPQETMTGWVAAGEKRTQLTHSVWPSSAEPVPMVNLQSPSVFHSLMVCIRIIVA